MRKEFIIGVGGKISVNNMRPLFQKNNTAFVCDYGYYLTHDLFNVEFLIEFSTAEAKEFEQILAGGTERSLEYFKNKLAVKCMDADLIADRIRESYDAGYIAAQTDIRDALGFI